MKYQVIYADPPWRYDFSRSNSRKIENHYPTMDIEDIKAVDVGEFCHTDAVLYLWATSPKLPEAFGVMNAWGFEYRACMVWDKKIIGMGYWARNQHELILIGTRGNFPQSSFSELSGAVFSVKRGEHSVKPLQVRAMIDKYHPNMSKIELFARPNIFDYDSGWDFWGNEAHSVRSGEHDKNREIT